jgi:alpha-methylacyl-CoA racemase
MTQKPVGPLEGVVVLEIGGMGPTPFAGMALADMGATVIRVERPTGLGLFPGEPEYDLLNRGKRSVAVDLKHPDAVKTVLSLVERADILIEGHRPGVMERLGLGPDQCHERNPALVYGRMTGWGQEGPLAMHAGHDVSYIAVTGALHAIGDAGGPPQIPINLVGDFGGGGTYMVMGVLAALLESRTTGRGRVVDAAIVDGAVHLLTVIHALINAGAWVDERGANMLDGGAPYYSVYMTADGRYMAAGAVEAKFYAEMLAKLGITDIDVAEQNDPATWPATRKSIADAFRQRTQAEWTKVFGSSDACVSPVLSLRDAEQHSHIQARGTLRLQDGVLEPAAAPRFSGIPVSYGAKPPRPGANTVDVLSEFGLDAENLITSGAAFQA